MIRILFLAILLSPALSFADGITITGFSRASNSRLASGTTAAAVWGGTAGAGACSSATDLCDTCVGSTVTACNEAAINNNLLLRISFTVTTDVNAVVNAEIENSANNFSDLNIVEGNTTYTKDSLGTIAVEWGDICNSFNSQSCVGAGNSFTTDFKISVGDATTTFQVTVHEPQETTVGASNLFNCTVAPTGNDSGICSWHAYPGDQKIYIRDLDAGGSDYPTNNTVRYTAFRVFFSETDFASANYSQGGYADINIPSGQDEPEPNTVDGLDNDVLYYFRSALVDEAKNVSFLIDEAYIDTLQNCVANDNDNCDMMAMPSAVYGLLPEDFNCFISTAAYGSSMAEEVKVFRKFRDTFLLGSHLGREFVKKYYDLGAKASHYIVQSEFLRATSRVALTPVLWFAKLSLKFGLFWAIGIFSLIPILISILFFQRRLKWLRA